MTTLNRRLDEKGSEVVGGRERGRERLCLTYSDTIHVK